MRSVDSNTESDTGSGLFGNQVNTAGGLFGAQEQTKNAPKKKAFSFAPKSMNANQFMSKPISNQSIFSFSTPDVDEPTADEPLVESPPQPKKKKVKKALNDQSIFSFSTPD